ncbi:MAG TPA: M20 family metallo-hydrolase [Acidobacteriaceae bacterium]
MTLHLNADRLLAELHHLAHLTDCPPTEDKSLPKPTQAVTRIVFTPRDLAARAWLKSLATNAGFSVREDAAGNTFLRWEGTDPKLGIVGTGSHTDAIPHAGMYDGTVGVLGGLEALRGLKESGFQPRRSLEVLMFTSEEPTRFGIGCIGSRLLGGAFDPDSADKIRDRLHEIDPNAPEGLTLREVREAAGFHGPLARVKLPANYFAAWIELHIEQGPLLERDNIQLGIVTNIAAPASYRFTVEGFGGHAGALLMPDRRDALCAAADLILSVERHALTANARAKAAGHSGVDTVATVGMVAVHPGAVNSVPSRVQLTLDIRDTDVARRNAVMAALHADIETIQRQRNVHITEDLINADSPALSDPHILATLESVCKSEGASYRRMVARAYHDTSFIAPIAPVAMLFIPCRNGVSHRPDEYSTPEAIALGVHVLALTLAKLSAE